MSLDKLVAALDECGRRGISADLWLRDDDAVDPTGALDTLLDLCESFSVPVTLAVIPETTTRRLAQHLDASDIAQVAVHGWSHTNYAGDGQKKQELGLHRELPCRSRLAARRRLSAGTGELRRHPGLERRKRLPAGHRLHRQDD